MESSFLSVLQNVPRRHWIVSPHLSAITNYGSLQQAEKSQQHKF